MKNSYRSNWILKDALGIFLGIAVAAGILTLQSQWIGQPETASGKLLGIVFALGGGLVAGSIIAWFQWSTLKTRFKQLSWVKWWRNTVLAFTSAWIIAIIPSFMYTGTNAMNEVVVPFGIPLFTVEYGSIIFGAMMGGLIGFGQWFELKKHLPKSGQWIGANVFSWSFGMFLIALSGLIASETTLMQGFLITGLIGGLLAALCIAGFTGQFFGAPRMEA